MGDSARSNGWCFLVGIDFGTTYSGVAWAYSNDSQKLDPQRHIHVVDDWPMKEASKVPSRIYYPNDGRKPTFGYEVMEGVDPLTWFKLLLINEVDLEEYIKMAQDDRLMRTRDQLKILRKSVMDVVTDYLRFLWTQTEAAIEKVHLRKVRNAPYVVVLTVPAIWKPDAIQKMRDAAKAAGILKSREAGETTLHIVAEPEAAAFATRSDCAEGNREDTFQSGESFVVLDAGGGTCDLITYHIDTVEPLRLSECVKGEGDLCGAIFLDEEFETELGEWIGDVTKIRNVRGGERYQRLIGEKWETGLKRQFEDQLRDWPFDVPKEWIKLGALQEFKKLFSKVGGKHKSVSDSEIRLTREQARSIFAPVYAKIMTLVENQVTTAIAKRGKKPRALLLAGGLGSNKYLCIQLKMKFGDMEILKRPGQQPWHAVCRGAVHRARAIRTYGVGAGSPGEHMNQDPAVVSRVARQSYGIKYHTAYLEGVHLESTRMWSEPMDEWRASRLMRWYLKQDSDVKEGETVKMPWIDYFEEGTQPTTHQVSILCCDVSSPPSVENSDVRTLCGASFRLPPLDTLPIHYNKANKKYRILSWELWMTPTGNSLVWSAWSGGRKLEGENEVQIQYR